MNDPQACTSIKPKVPRGPRAKRLTKGQREEFDEQTPECVEWTVDEVAHWIGRIGFQQYEACFRDNCINGRKLIWMDASRLPKIGITNFQHVKEISKAIRELLNQRYPDYRRSIALPDRDRLGMFLECKSRTGWYSDDMKFSDFVQSTLKVYELWPELE